MRWLYSLLLYLLTPFLCLRFAWQSARGGDDWRRLPERFGRAPRGRRCAVWVHAVSVGEVMAAVPLVRELLRRHPGEVLLTTTTATGSAQVREVFGELVQHSYLPLDLPHVVRRFVARVQPGRVVVMETELWPNLFRVLRARGIPLAIANGRVSVGSFPRYARLKRGVSRVLADCSLIAAQSEADARRFRDLGAPESRVAVMGNLKFDFDLPEEQVVRGRALRARLGLATPVWLAASTHEGEDELVLAAHRAVRATHPAAVLVLVPRHPGRFDAVARLVNAAGMQVRRRSELGDWTHGTELLSTPVLLGDSMGELAAYYAAADVAFVGGSLVPVGGHNILEPAALELPVVFGPHMANFEAARELLLERGGARQVESAGQLVAAVSELLGNAERRTSVGQAARAAFSANRGALQRFLALFDALP